MKIAMIQLKNYYYNQQKGKVVATRYIREAARAGAEMVILPESSACGYIPNQSIWKYSEPTEGDTAEWACSLSKELSIYIGMGFTEYREGDYYNAYLLSNPQGKVDGIIRKEDAEAYCFKRQRGQVYIDTEIGRIGLGICVDNHHASYLQRIKDANVDIMLMPHSNPAPFKLGNGISQKDKDMLLQQPYELAKLYSSYLNVFTLYINPVGDFPDFMGGLGVRNYNESFKLLGGTLACDMNGNLITKMNDKEGYVIIEATLGKGEINKPFPRIYNKDWLHQGNTIYRKIVLPYLIRKGTKNYEANRLLK